jgi:hypothetical protein
MQLKIRDGKNFDFYFMFTVFNNFQSYDISLRIAGSILSTYLEFVVSPSDLQITTIISRK